MSLAITSAKRESQEEMIDSDVSQAIGPVVATEPHHLHMLPAMYID